MTTSQSVTGTDEPNRAQEIVDNFFAALDASEPWEVELMYAKADALIWVRDTVGVYPCPPRVAFRISAAAAMLVGGPPRPDVTAYLIEVAGDALRDHASRAA